MRVQLLIAKQFDYIGNYFLYFNDYTFYLHENWEVTKQSHGGTSEFSFVLEERYNPSNPDFDVDHNNLLNRQVLLENSSRGIDRIFGGVITKADASTLNPQTRRFNCRALGWEHILDLSTFSASYTSSLSQGDILGGNQSEGIQSCFAHADSIEDDPFKQKFNGWIRERIDIEDGIKDITELSYNKTNIRQLFNKFALDAGYIWGVTANRSVFFLPGNSRRLKTDIIIADEHPDLLKKRNVYPAQKFQYIIDATKLRNHIVLRGDTVRKPEVIKQTYAYTQLDTLPGGTVILELNRNFLEYEDPVTGELSDTPRVFIQDAETNEERELVVGAGVAQPDVTECVWIQAGVRSTILFERHIKIKNTDKAVRVESQVNESIEWEDVEPDSLERFGRFTQVIIDTSIRTDEQASSRIRSELNRLSKGVEVLKFEVLVDTSKNEPNSSYIIRTLDVGKTFQLINKLHRLDREYQVDTYSIEHLGGEVYNLRITAKIVIESLIAPGEKTLTRTDLRDEGYED